MFQIEGLRSRTSDSHHKIQVFSDPTLQENLSAAVKLPINKRFLGNPTLWKSLVRENLVIGTGCTRASVRVRVCVSRRWARAHPSGQVIYV